jgi:peroxiredoxin
MKRMTFLIDEGGTIQQIWSTVKPEGHATEVLEAIRLGDATSQ